MNLYQINQEILSCVDMESGELLDEEKFEALQITLEEKLEGMGCWIKNLEADAAALKAEEQALAERRKSVERTIANKKEFLTRFLNGRSFETSKVKISFRKSESLEVSDGAKIPEEYLRFKEPEVNKAELKKAVKNGLIVDGVQLVERQNLQLK